MDQGTENGIKEKVRAFIISHFLLGNDSIGLNDDSSFIDEGIVDSTGVMELVSFVEETFDFRLEDEELIPDNLDSISNLVFFITGKQEGKTDG